MQQSDDAKIAELLVNNTANNDDNDDDDNQKSTIVLKEFTECLRNNDNNVSKAIKEYTEKYVSKLTPQPYIPPIHDILNPNFNYDSLAIKHSSRTLKVRMFRFIALLIAPLIILILATLYSIPFIKIIGIMLLLLFTAYISIVLALTLSVGYNNCLMGDQRNMGLYRIYSISESPFVWANINIGYVQLLYRPYSVQSVSEVSAINGGVLKVMLNVLGAYSWEAVLAHYAAQLWFNRGDDIGHEFEWDYADILQLIGSLGILTISMFELDPFNSVMETLHGLGAMMACCLMAAYCIQQYYIGTKFAFAIILSVFGMCSFIAWRVVCVAAVYAGKGPSGGDLGKIYKALASRCCNKEKLEKVSINMFSKLNIVLEAVGIYCVSLCFGLYFIDYNDNCEVGCV